MHFIYNNIRINNFPMNSPTMTMNLVYNVAETHTKTFIIHKPETFRMMFNCLFVI